MKIIVLIIAGIFAMLSMAYGEVKQETYRISMSEVKAVKTVAYKRGAVFDKDILAFTVNNATGKQIRLVHDTIKVLALIDGADDTVTTTLYAIEEFDTEKQALAKIMVLGLEYDADANKPLTN